MKEEKQCLIRRKKIVSDEPDEYKELEEEDTAKETQDKQVEAAVVSPVDESNTPVEKEEVTQSKSSIIRGVPKVTKPAPPVVAIKMADLIGAPEDEPVDQNKS